MMEKYCIQNTYYFRHPDWKDVPIEHQVTIKKPPSNCSQVVSPQNFLRGISNISANKAKKKEEGSCTFKNIDYQDLDEIPTGNCCASCFCDFGKIECTNPDCIECLKDIDHHDIIEQYDDNVFDQDTMSTSIKDQGNGRWLVIQPIKPKKLKLYMK